MANETQILLNHYLNKKTNRNLHLFWAGFIVYSAALCYSTVLKTNYTIAIPFQATGLVLFIFGAANLIKFNFQGNYLKILFIIYGSWLCLVILRGFTFEYQYIKDMLFSAERGILLYFVPIILLFPQSIFFYKKLFGAIIVLGIIFIIYDIIFIDNLLNLKDYLTDVSSPKYTYDHFTKILSVPVGFVILTYSYHSNKIKLFSFFVAAVTIVFAIIRARRGLIFLSAAPLLFALIFSLFVARQKVLNASLCIIMLFLVIIVAPKIYTANENGMLSLLRERIYDDTRNPIEDCFYSDMKLKDWLIGKGINGRYYCPGIDENDKTGYRTVIETDFLNIILKGGIISIALFLLIAIPAIIKGLFYSKNLLSKAAGAWIFLWIIGLYPATVYTFSLHNLLVWISIGICYNKVIRKTPETEMRSNFFKAIRSSKKRLEPVS